MEAAGFSLRIAVFARLIIFVCLCVCGSKPALICPNVVFIFKKIRIPFNWNALILFKWVGNKTAVCRPFNNFERMTASCIMSFRLTGQSRSRQNISSFV